MRVLLTAFLLCIGLSVHGQWLLSPQQSEFSSTDPEWYASRFMCTMSADTTGVSPAVCNQTPTGSAFFTFINATQPVQMFLDGIGAPYSGTGISNTISPGAHFVIIVDGMACRDTVNFFISEPPPITISSSTTDAICFGQPSGTGSAQALGGVGNFIYQWEPCAGGTVQANANVSGLAAGCYNITATDANGCEVIAQDTVAQPTAITYTSTVDSVSCFQGIDGSATISASGGTGSLSYLWDNGQTTTLATGLDAKFHYVTITDQANCTVVAEVLVPGPLRVDLDSIAKVNPTCFGVSNGSATAFVQGGTPPYSYFWSAGIGSGNTVSGLSSGNFRVTVVDSHGCRDSLSFLLNAPPPLSTVPQNVVHETCAGLCNGSVNIFASGGTPGYQYLWNTPTVPNGTSNPNNLCAQAYTVTVSDARGCTGTVNFTINPGNDLTLQVSGTDPRCHNSTNGSVQVTAFGGTSPYTYTWSNGQSTPSITGLGCGAYTVQVRDNRGCRDSANYVLNCPAQLVIDSLLSDSVRCFGQTNGSLQVFSSGGTTPYTFRWNDINQQTNPTAINLPAGQYMVTVTDANGCTVSSSGTVLSPAALAGGLVASPVLCFGDSTGAITAQITGGTPNYTYTWTPSAASTPGLVNLPAGAYQLTVTDQKGCSFSPTQASISQPAAPLTMSTDVLDQPCFGQADGEAVVFGNGGTGNISFAWSNGKSGSNISGLAAGVYQITATDANNCSLTDSVTIIALDSIEVNIAVTQPTCYGFTNGQAGVNFISGGAGNGTLSDYQFQWSIPTPPNATFMSDLEANQYAITVTDMRGCKQVVNFELTQPERIRPYLSANSLRCFGDTTGIVMLDSITGDQPITDLLWSTGSNDPVGLSSLSAGSYSITATDLSGCTGTASITIDEPTQIKVDSFTTVSPICFGDANGSVTAYASGANPPYAYQWSNGVQQAITITDLMVGVYYVTVNDAFGCQVIDSVYLLQPEALTYTTQIQDVSCFGSTDGRIKIATNGGTKPYQFILDGASPTQSGIFLGLNAGDHTLQITDAEGCKLNSTVQISSPARIEVDLGDERTVMFGESTNLQPIVLNTVGQTFYNWYTSGSDSIACVNGVICTEVMVRPNFDAVYHLIVEDENGCIGEDKVLVRVEKNRGVYVPNAFTPNSDGENDLMVVFGKAKMVKEISTLRVFDRFGSMVFELENFQPNDMTLGWDGKFKGKECDPGVFTFYLEAIYLDGFADKMSGHITLIR